MRTETVKDIIELFDNADIMMAYHDMLCGDLISEGCSRIVYECDYDKSCVVKIHKDVDRLPSDNILEWELWEMIDSGWKVGECIEAERITISYNHTKYLEALKNIAEAYKTEWEIANKTIHLRKVEYNRDNPLPVAYGKGNGFRPGIKREISAVPIEILAVQGGERNIDFSTYGNSELLLPKGQRIKYDGVKFEDEPGFDLKEAREYLVDAEGLTIQRADKPLVTYEDASTDLSHIYPKRVGKVTKVEKTDNDFYNFFDSSIPESLDYSKCRIDGEKMTVIFQTGMLAGKEFDIMQSEKSLTGYKHSERKFMLVSQEYDGQTMPNDIYSIEEGDEYAVFGMKLPDAYMRDDTTKTGASWELFRESAKVLYEEEQIVFTFNGNLSPLWTKIHWSNIGGKLITGGYVRLIDEHMLEFDNPSILIRITKVTQSMNKPFHLQISLANAKAATYASDFREIQQNEVKAEAENKNTGNFVKRSYRGMMELVDNIYSPSGSFQNDVLSANALRSMMLALGDELLQYSFMDSNYNNEIEPAIGYNTDKHWIECPKSYIRHNTLGFSKETLSGKSKKEYLYWDVPAFNTAVLTDKPSQFYYLYLRVSKNHTVNEDGLKIGSGEWFISPDKIEFDSEANSYVLLTAFINSEEDGNRNVTNLFGFAELTPGMLRINNIASVDGNSFFKFLANQFRIGDENRAIEWNIIEGLLQIINATLEMKNSDGVTVAKIDGDNGSAMFAKGNALFDENGDVNITGRLESNKDGNRIIIDPEQQALVLKDQNGNDAGMLYFNTSSGGNYSASLILKGESGGQFGDTTNIIQSGGIRTYSVSSGHNGYYGSGKLDVESKTAGFHADCTGADGKLEYITENMPDSPHGQKKWQQYCGDDGIVRMIKE